MNMEEKIAKLLRKAEGTNNAAEAEAYTKKAESLMLKLGIEEAVIRAKMEGESEAPTAKIIEERMHFRGSYAQGLQMMACSIGNGMGLRTLVSKSYNGSERTAYLIGFEKDVKRTVELVQSLQLQVSAAQTAWWRSFDPEEKHWMSGMEKFKARREFIISFGRAVERRLREQREQFETESTGTELVLVNQRKKIDDWVDDKYTLRKSGGRGLDGSYSGRAAGYAAGQRASLGGSAVSGGRTALS